MWKGIRAEIVSSFHLASLTCPLLGRTITFLPGRAQRRRAHQLGRKMWVGKEVTHQAWSHLIAICHGHSSFRGECGADVNAFEKHSFHHGPGRLCQLLFAMASAAKLARSQKSAFNLYINSHGVLTRHKCIQMLSLLVLTGGGEGTTGKGLAAPTVTALIRFSAVISCF